MNTRINPEYTRKMEVAADLACRAFLAGGVDGMHAELQSLRRTDACPLIIAEVERRYHAVCVSQKSYVVVCRQTGAHLRPATEVEAAEFRAKNRRPAFERATLLDSGVLVDEWGGYGGSHAGAGF